MKRNKRHTDLTRTTGAEDSVGAQLEALIKTITDYNLQELKLKFLDIINDSETSISPMKANEYKSHVHRIYRLDMMQDYIVNIYMSAANMGMKQLKRK